VSTETDQAHTEAELQAALERLKAENAALESRGSKGVSMKVSEKGGVSVYGLGRFPVTLYLEQWTKLLDLADDIREAEEEGVNGPALASPSSRSLSRSSSRSSGRWGAAAAAPRERSAA
jgi:hypothetical protein